jgi:predicted transcriptional regulator
LARLIVAKKSISMEIPESLALSLDELAKRTGRKKNILLAASLNDFLKATEEEQEKIIRKYLDAYRK